MNRNHASSLKRPVFMVKLMALIVIALVFFTSFHISHAQTNADSATNAVGIALPPAANDAISSFITTFSTSHPWVAMLFTIIGAIRFIMKPAITVWHNYVVSTASPNDDKVYTAVVESKPFTWGTYLLDLIFSWKPKPVVTQIPKS